MRPGRFLVLLIVVLGAGLLAWNGARFIGTKAKARTKDLDFLPPPVVAQAMSCGQQTALAKLRWIDSFAYFQLQLERRSDTVAGTDRRGGFERLYETLVTMDPQFLPFYEHAVLNTSGLLKRFQASLGILMRGLIARPHDSELWRLSSAELAVNFAWTKSNPAGLDRWLNAWAHAETDESGAQRVMEWRRGLAFANVQGLQTLRYWIDNLRSTQPGTPLADFVEGTVRELLAEHGVRELEGMLNFDREVDGSMHGILAESLYPRLFRHITPAVVRNRYPNGVPPWAPVEMHGTQARLRSDPFGYPWQCEARRVLSVGLEQRRFKAVLQAQRNALEAEAQRRGRPPRDLVEAGEWGFPLPAPPYGGRWSFEQNLPDVVWPDPPDKPWPLR